jgi:hypothetical protein
MSGIQGVLLEYGVTDFAHDFFSIYFYIELLLLGLLIVTGFRHKISVLLFIGIFIFEAVIFIIRESPISPDVVIMILVGLIRIYILIRLIKKLFFKSTHSLKSN